MNQEWSLQEIYRGLEDPAYESDIAALEKLISDLKNVTAGADTMEPVQAAEQMLRIEEQIQELYYNLDIYLELRRSADTENGEVMAQGKRLGEIAARIASAKAAVKVFLSKLPEIEKLTEQSPILKEYEFLLKENQRSAKHLLPEEMEEIIANMDQTGGKAWGNLFQYLTSTVKVEYNGTQVTLPEIRNLAYSPDRQERREAYQAELACYGQIMDSLAFALNNIKSQVIMLSKKRGYESPLEMTLEQSRMSRETLDAMMVAIQEYLPVIRKYLKKKAALLGYENGLPWYELFAPMGKSDRTFTLEQAEEYLTDIFAEFSPDMAALIKEAFEESWIDFYPRKGKEGGAFCASVPRLKQSRVLTNYDGSFGAVDTLAHELGHAYHNRQIEGNRPLKQDYPMPVAETASTFHETHLMKTALKRATGEEKLNLLDNDLREQTQCIVDIYSRYLFETSVFDQCRNRFLMAEDCCRLMQKAQEEAYGDALDPQYLHPYMWACKNHYYSSKLSFYNFPYAFGNLFALGLYRKFEMEGKEFTTGYQAMLKATPCCKVEEAAAMAGIDLTCPDFWRQSLSLIAEEVDEFCKF